MMSIVESSVSNLTTSDHQASSWLTGTSLLRWQLDRSSRKNGWKPIDVQQVRFVTTIEQHDQVVPTTLKYPLEEASLHREK